MELENDCSTNWAESTAQVKSVGHSILSSLDLGYLVKDKSRRQEHPPARSENTP